ncbi:hypothetical protein FRX31_003789 [Thalictrum thalictroides]|uniref:DUF4283 domain-containing protein n=1 Tax=Thalictrum thalictroides TaxID=46969 RepID=A0A7J6XA00_THATH|nr:hypothetical protein FRX31_003789 [Thalictrum thalictroides]
MGLKIKVPRDGISFLLLGISKRLDLWNGLNQKWKVRNFYYFKFAGLKERRRVLEGGPIFVAGRIMVIREWLEEVFEERKQITSIPIWVKCYDIPMQLWSRQGLSLIGSRIGTPKCCDEFTKRRKRLEFAKLCIEVKADTNFPTALKFKLGEGIEATVGG